MPTTKLTLTVHFTYAIATCRLTTLTVHVCHGDLGDLPVTSNLHVASHQLPYLGVASRPVAYTTESLSSHRTHPPPPVQELHYKVRTKAKKKKKNKKTSLLRIFDQSSSVMKTVPALGRAIQRLERVGRGPVAQPREKLGLQRNKIPSCPLLWTSGPINGASTNIGK